MGHKLIPEPPRKIIQRLARHGFVETRQRGGHRRFLREAGGKRYLVTVPMHPRDLTQKEIKSIIEQGGLTRDEFYGD